MLVNQLLSQMGDGSWSPRRLASLFAWYRGDTVTLDGSGNVSTWPDLSGHAYDAAQPDAAHRPAYVANAGIGFASFTSPQSLVVSASPAHVQPVEVVAVVRPASATPAITGYLFDSGTGSRTVVGQSVTTGTVALYAGTFVTGAQLTAADHIVGVQFNGASSVLSLDGVDGSPISIGTQALDATMTIGDYGGGGYLAPFIGRYYELVVFSSLLSAPDRALMVAYLKSRYSIA